MTLTAASRALTILALAAALVLGGAATALAQGTPGCGPGQVDINTADLEELTQIIHVDLVTAQEIIDLRPFDSVDDLSRVTGLDDAAIDAVRDQGLACASAVVVDPLPETVTVQPETTTVQPETGTVVLPETATPQVDPVPAGAPATGRGPASGLLLLLVGAAAAGLSGQALRRRRTA